MKTKSLPVNKIVFAVKDVDRFFNVIFRGPKCSWCSPLHFSILDPAFFPY